MLYGQGLTVWGLKFKIQGAEFRVQGVDHSLGSRNKTKVQGLERALLNCSLESQKNVKRNLGVRG